MMVKMFQRVAVEELRLHLIQNGTQHENKNGLWFVGEGASQRFL